MPVLQLEAQLTTADLLRAVGQLEMPDLDNFVSQVIDLRARRVAPSLPRREGELLLAISEAFPADDRRRYEELLAKRDEESLTSVEYDELLRLTDRMEEWDAQRLARLAELAALRGKALTALMVDLGLKVSPNG